MNMTAQILKLQSRIQSHVSGIEHEKKMNENLQYILKGLSVLLKLLVADLGKFDQCQHKLILVLFLIKKLRRSKFVRCN